MTRCCICSEPCAGSESTSNPFCLRCVLLNFGGNETALWELDMAESRDRQRAYNQAQSRMVERLWPNVPR
jgi:hypothetical protein